MKVPRALWELTIMTVAKQATTAKQSAAIYLMLALLTGSTAIFDLFFWAPTFAFFAQFETCRYKGWFFHRQKVSCEPTDFSKGYGRLLVSLQSLGVGIFYLMTTIVAWGAFVSIREEHKVDRGVRIRQKWDELQKRGLRGNAEPNV